ncbi:hypothetical protein [Bacillus sp. SM2101]|uniref:hypothetical protein n=1 Tax=Bacillus sp. SM2101 TaxID=2805366 RepID=UPI001BDF1BA5|nr:hypothetical protein [Bacillus sp. SM2101]
MFKIESGRVNPLSPFYDYPVAKSTAKHPAMNLLQLLQLLSRLPTRSYNLKYNQFHLIY